MKKIIGKLLIIIMLALMMFVLFPTQPVLGISDNFTEYTEVDALSRLTVTASRVTWTDMRCDDDQVYLYKDSGVNYYSGSFNITLTLRITSTTQGGSQMHPWTMANDLNDWNGLNAGNKSALTLGFLRMNSPDELRLHLMELDSGTEYSSYLIPSENTDYYITLIRDESVGTYGTLYAYIYSDSARTVLITTLSVALHTSKKDFRYILLAQSQHYTPTLNNPSSGYVEDLTIVNMPTVTTQAASGIGTTTATGNGNITAVGEENADERGFEWDTDSGAPYTNNVTVSGNFTTGAYTGNLTGLPPGNIIYYRAMAHNSAGWGYGDELTFNTNYLYEMSLWVDGVEVTTALTNEAIPNTSTNWTFASGNTTLYLTRQRIWLGGSLKQDISWQYSPTEPVYLYDASGNGNTATPTLRTSGSSANVTANLTSFAPITPTTSDPTNPAITADNLTAPFDEPPNLYSELNLSFPGAALINELLDGANIPRALFWFPIIFGLLNLIGLATYALTRSIMIQGIVIGFLIILASIMGGFGYWVAIEFTIMAIAITIASRQYGW